MFDATTNKEIFTQVMEGVKMSDLAIKYKSTNSHIQRTVQELINRMKRPSYHVEGAASLGKISYSVTNIRNKEEIRSIFLDRLEILTERDKKKYGDEIVPYSIGKGLKAAPVKTITKPKPKATSVNTTFDKPITYEGYFAVAFVEDIKMEKVILRTSNEFRIRGDAVIAVQALRLQFKDNAKYGIHRVVHHEIEEI